MELISSYQSPPPSPSAPQQKDDADENEVDQSHTQDKKRPICQVCGNEIAKYRCPACDCRSCSLDCSKKHKVEANCTGQRDITKYISIDQFSDNNLQDDFNFLENVNRVADNAKRRGNKGEADNSHHRKQSNLNYAQKQLARQAGKRNIKLKFMPSGMTRRNCNTTVFDSSKRKIMWRVEWIFPKDNFKMVEESVDETHLINEVLSQRIHDISIRHHVLPYLKEGVDNLILLLKIESTPVNQPAYYILDLHKSLKEELQHKEIIEFPSIYIILPSDKSKYSIMECTQPQESHFTDESATCNVVESEDNDAEEETITANLNGREEREEGKESLEYNQ